MTFDRWWRENKGQIDDASAKAAAAAAWEAGRRDLMAVTSRAALTPMQQQVLDIAIDHWALHGRSPTQQQIADTLGVSKTTVFQHLAELEKKGVIARTKHKARQIWITGA